MGDAAAASTCYARRHAQDSVPGSDWKLMEGSTCVFIFFEHMEVPSFESYGNGCPLMVFISVLAHSQEFLFPVTCRHACIGNYHIAVSGGWRSNTCSL